MHYPIALRISKFTKVQAAQKMGYLWTKNMKLVTTKVENLCRGQSGPAIEKTSKYFFGNRPLHGTNITQIFPFVKTTELHNIQPVPIV